MVKYQTTNGEYMCSKLGNKSMQRRFNMTRAEVRAQDTSKDLYTGRPVYMHYYWNILDALCGLEDRLLSLNSQLDTPKPEVDSAKTLLSYKLRDYCNLAYRAKPRPHIVAFDEQDM